ncbi:MAG: hypothetical protein WCS70_04760 [Verrucomicrobiota bacterium]
MNEPGLSKLLRQWRDIEPRGDFEANVLRRIRLAGRAPARPFWLWQPAFSVAAAVIVALVIGGWTGLRTRPEATGFLAGDTLTGRYLELTHR